MTLQDRRPARAAVPQRARAVHGDPHNIPVRRAGPRHFQPGHHRYSRHVRVGVAAALSATRSELDRCVSDPSPFLSSAFGPRWEMHYLPTATAHVALSHVSRSMKGFRGGVVGSTSSFSSSLLAPSSSSLLPTSSPSPPPFRLSTQLPPRPLHSSHLHRLLIPSSCRGRPAHGHHGRQ